MVAGNSRLDHLDRGEIKQGQVTARMLPQKKGKTGTPFVSLACSFSRAELDVGCGAVRA